MKNSNFLNIFRPKSIVYFIFLVVFSVITFLFSPLLGTVEIGIIILLFIIDKFINFNRNAKLNEYLNDLSMSSDSITKEFALNSVLPLAIIKNSSDIIWYNNGFEQLFFNEETKDAASIKDIFKDFPEGDDTGKINATVKYKEKYFNVLGTTVNNSHSQNQSYSMLYFIDISEEKNLRKELNDKAVVFGKIVIDNFDEVIGVLSEGERAVVIADTDKHIFSWANNAEAFIKKLEKNRYLIIFENKNLEKYLNTEFEKLRNLKGITENLNQPLTLSIGIGNCSDSPVKANEFSDSSIDMALGRGGDQVVVKNKDGFSFYGGNSKEVEKRTKVRSRVVAHALRELIESKDNIIIMGHKNSDMDFMGSALGLYRACKTFKKNCYILLDEISPSIEDICNKMALIDEYKDIIINNAQAEILLAENGMLIIADTHRLALMPYPELTDSAETIVLIDHHRKSADFYGNAVLTYHETYSSSTSELIAEILQYISDDVKLNTVEAMALYAGILLDTQNFTFKTGVRTFEAASYLRRSGLNTAEAKELLKSHLNDYILRNKIVSSASIYNNDIAISTYTEEPIKDKAVAAQSADELLNIKGINTTFVLYKNGNMYAVSARSIGDVNVQMIMEKLGGGGHQLAAGAQFEAENDDDAFNKLKAEIDEHIKKEDKK